MFKIGDRTQGNSDQETNRKTKSNRQLKGNNRSAHGVIYFLKPHVGVRMSVYSNYLFVTYRRKTRCYNRYLQHLRTNLLNRPDINPLFQSARQRWNTSSK